VQAWGGGGFDGFTEDVEFLVLNLTKEGEATADLGGG